MIAASLRQGGRAYGNAYVLLILTALFFGGNTVAGKLALGEVSPMAVVMLRWIIVSGVLTIALRKRIAREWPLIRRHLWVMAAMAIVGFVGFNSLFYVSARYTNAVNMGIIQGSIPVLVLLGSVAVFHTRVAALQGLGILATLGGVALVASHGDLSSLASLALNPGDGIMLIACIFYTGYTLALRNRPPISGLVFFTVLSIFAAIGTLPLIAYEIVTGTVQWPTPTGWLVVLYISLFPSCLAQIFFIRGVEMIGPARAGVFINLVPVFAAILAVLILGEDFQLFHGIAMGLVLGGIWLSERFKATG
ncbi:DMT family transporter [Roseibium aestuarii]|uniref:DMT family transporter n=1 Tax=Roseibium aestuarii TaxID=2600299 RepID=A0ABW4JUX4_9HYPH|nr:DMT family transporter [Roseibium aestuarii]